MADKKERACIILAGGQGTRMKSSRPKAMHEIAGRPMLGWLLETCEKLGAKKIIVVTAPGQDAIAELAAPHTVVVQEKPLGTADAVKAALPALGDFFGNVFILLGDMPMIAAETLEELAEAANHDEVTRLAVLGAEFEKPPAFGRIVLGTDGRVSKIVEDKDCTAEERNIKLCNSGAFCVDGHRLAGWIEKIGNDNAQNEFYLTDIVAVAAEDGAKTRAHICRDLDQIRGVNARTDLAVLEKIMQEKLRTNAMEGGATLTDPDSVFFSWDTKVGQDVTIEPNVFFAHGVTVGNGVHIKSNCYFEQCELRDNVTIGPFARVRPGSVIGEKSKIGNFVEIKNATLGKGVKAGHLAYIGDADVGDDVNFSCGAITVNYDGFEKHKTTIGDGAMVGSNVNLVAPVTIGDGAYLAAGSTITKDVPADALAVAREKPTIIDGWAAQNRDKKYRTKKKAG